MKLVIAVCAVRLRKKPKESQRATNSHVKALPVTQLAGQVFHNRAYMRPVKASAEHERHQVGLHHIHTNGMGKSTRTFFQY